MSEPSTTQNTATIRLTVAQALVRAGYTVYADDHRGHGRTGLEQWDGDHSRLGRLGPGGLRAAIDGVEAFADLVRAEEPGLPFGVVAQSWGSLMVQKLLDERPDLWDAVVLTGTAYRWPGSMDAGDLNRRHVQPDGTVTAVTPVRPLPATVTRVPPETGPAAGTALVTVGAAPV